MSDLCRADVMAPLTASAAEPGPGRWIVGRLGVRVVLLIAGVLLATSLLFLAILTPLYRHEILQERMAASVKLGSMLQLALENAMLKRDLPGLKQIVSDLGRMPNVDLAMIVEPKGEVRFSSDGSLIGATREPAAICEGCRPAASGEARSEAAVAGFVRNEHGREVLRSVRAVANREPCGQCHGPSDSHPVNGYLVVDYAAADVMDRTWSMAAVLSSAGLVVIVAALASIWFVLQRAVIAPIGKLAGAIAISAQSPAAPALMPAEFVGRGDEISDLAQGWNSLAARFGKVMGAMREREQFQQELIDAIPDGVRVIADDYSVVAANAAFCRQSGLGMKEVLSSPCYASSHGRDQPCVPTLVGCPLYELDRHQEPVKYSHIHLDRGRGKNFAAEVFAAPLKSALPGHPRLVVESIRNLTQQVEVTHEQRLSELGQLAAGVAHEIHNPLASIRLGVHAIQRAVEKGESGAETREYMSAVNTELDRCLKVTEKLMRLSRLPDERGVLIDLAVVVRDVMTLLRYEAELLQIRMTLTAADDVRIIASEPDLGMVMINLMQNAFHAMPKGGCLSLDIARNEARDVIITGGDTGVGIEPSHLPLIFHPFWSWRADGSAGSGLGLAICKSSVAKWGGRIEVRSEVGVGTTFVLTFPHANKTLDV